MSGFFRPGRGGYHLVTLLYLLLLVTLAVVIGIALAEVFAR